MHNETIYGNGAVGLKMMNSRREISIVIPTKNEEITKYNAFHMNKQ